MGRLVGDGNTDGSFDAVTLSFEIQGWILQAEVVPDTSAAGAYPTDNYDVTLTSDRGIDLLGGAGADFDSSTAKIVLPTPDGTNVSPVFNDGDTYLDILGNSVNGAVIYIYIYWRKIN